MAVEKIADSGRFDMTRGEVAQHVVALITAESMEVGAQYMSETFSDPLVEDLPSAIDAAGMMIGHLVQVIWRCKQDPWAATVIDAAVLDLVQESLDEAPDAPRGRELYEGDDD